MQLSASAPSLGIPARTGRVVGVKVLAQARPQQIPAATSQDAASPVAAPAAGFSRRDAMAMAVAAPMVLSTSGPAYAVQGLTAGRIPGLATTPDENGLFEYMRPEGKSGGHGVGWSEIPRYSFKVPSGWAEIPVSIADLGGTEIDLRYQSKDQGDISVVVAPIMRFSDIGFNANVVIEDLGTPKKIIQGFGPELFGKPVDDEDILNMEVDSHDGLTYYYFETKPHNLVACTSTGNRMFILAMKASARQWKKHAEVLQVVQKTFRVPKVVK